MNRGLPVVALIISILAFAGGLIIFIPYIIGIESIRQMNLISILSGLIALLLAISFFAYFLFSVKKK